LGQHLVKALGGTATIVTGSTYPVNISYPDDDNFDIIDVGEGNRVYAPIRLTMEEEQDRLNDEVMELSQEHIDQVLKSVRKFLGPTNKPQPLSVPKKDFGKDGKPKLVPGNTTIKRFGEN